MLGVRNTVAEPTLFDCPVTQRNKQYVSLSGPAVCSALRAEQQFRVSCCREGRAHETEDAARRRRATGQRGSRAAESSRAAAAEQSSSRRATGNLFSKRKGIQEQRRSRRAGSRGVEVGMQRGSASKLVMGATTDGRIPRESKQTTLGSFRHAGGVRRYKLQAPRTAQQRRRQQPCAGAALEQHWQRPRATTTHRPAARLRSDVRLAFQLPSAVLLYRTWQSCALLFPPWSCRRCSSHLWT